MSTHSDAQPHDTDQSQSGANTGILASTQPMTSWQAELRVHAAGRDWFLQRPADFDSLWENMVAEGRADADEHIPYWTELWPSSLVLAEWIARNAARIQGKLCLDVGCGLGLTAQVASHLGARVVAMDYETEALHYARLGAVRNRVPMPLWVAMDWRRPAVRPGSVDFVWGGDIMYERRFVAPVLRLCAHALRDGGRVWVAEPGREVYTAFLQALDSFGWQGRKVLENRVAALYAQSCPVTVGIWELARKR